ncbi:hypothetical protein [Actinomycetospora termitidis]|uniref:Uncharacterized protein n=1 Tax=Actinomycetospora termitidis TaxID=3053470 RepID=A0ABT7MH18_9PSEU|nr:hypothetical protein [Actinomycetospora sp. Odt1-22]MDL5159984.1 hypothetical protein [Actinomycetospora sp. Odt1-22]
MTEGRTGVSEADTEVDRTSADSATDDTATGHGTGPAVGNGSGSAQDEGTEPQAGETVPAATLPGEQPTEAEPTEDQPTDAADEGRHAASEDDEAWADAEDKAYNRELRKGLAFGLAGGLVVGAIVALLLGAFVYPGYLMGPGSPDDTANQAVTALTAKDAPALDQLSCRGPDGAAVSQLSPQVLQLVASVKPSGPTTTVIDTEARTPVDLTLTFQGQSQTLPSEIVLGQSGGSWCVKGLAQRQ